MIQPNFQGIAKMLNQPQIQSVALVIVLTFFIIGNGMAQTPVIDSLRILFQQTPKDSQKIVLCQELLRNFYLRSSDSTLVYLNRGKALAQKINSPKWVANFTYIRALLYEQTDSREKAIQQYLVAKPLYEALRDTKNLLKVHAALISRYNEIDNLEAALTHFELAKKYLKPHNLEGQASLNNRLGLIYGEREENQVALRYFQENLPLYYQMQDNYGLGFTHENIGTCYDELGQIDSALFYLEKGVEYQRLSNKPHALSENLSAFGDFYIKQGNYELALNYVQEAVALMQSVNSNFYITEEYTKLANIYLQLQDYDKAIFYGEKALDLANQTQDFTSKPQLLATLSESNALQNNFQNAYTYSQKQIEVRDSLAQKANKKVIFELEAKYQNQQKQAQIELQNSQLSRQKILLMATGIIGFLLLLLTFFVYRIAIERKKVNQELQKLDATKSNFFANVAHELRTPLTLILAPLENTLQSKTKQVSRADLKLAHSNSQKLLGLVNEILDLSKLENGKLNLVTKKVHLKNLIHRIFYAFESFAHHKGIHLKLEYQLSEQIWVALDIPKFEKILNNLLSNALKFSKEGDHVDLTVLQSKKGSLLLKVSDTGSGIPKKDLPYIFNRYYQSPSENSSLQGGTGIGLALAYEYTRLFGGDLKVESVVDKGSTFSLNLPLKTVEPLINESIDNDILTPTIKKETAYEPAILWKEKPKILVVEDNQEMSNYLVKILSPTYHCTTAYNGQIALETLQKNRFDLITSDVMMPQMDGFTFLKKVHERELFSRIPVILLTARSLKADKLKGLQLGVDDYITKPFNAKELIARIDNLLTNKQKRESWQAQKNERKILPVEQQLLTKAEQLVYNNLSNTAYNVELLAKEMNYSRRQLVRIIKKLTGLSPLNFIKEIRLQEARQLLEARQFSTIAEVSFEVGFAHPSYFSKVYQERFGKKPSEI